MRRDFILYEGPSLLNGDPIIAVGTGVERLSQNKDTGPMIQITIIRSDMHPREAIVTGKDAAICGTCPLRGLGDGTLRSCYVRESNGPAAIYRRYLKDGYARPSLDEVSDMMRGQDVRLGAYGEPTAIPVSHVYALLEQAKMWTGYTHTWAALSLAGKAYAWQAKLMASVESEQQAHDAMRLGWRPFLALPEGREVPDHAFRCPKSRDEDDPRYRQCIDCGACAGTRDDEVNTTAAYPWVPFHGGRRKNYNRLLQISATGSN